MIYNFDVIKSYVITLGGFTDSDKLDLQIQAIINEVLAYCYRECVPEAMELPLAEVIVNELNRRGFSESALGFDGDVTSYKEGDMQVNFGSSSSVTGTNTTAKYGGKLEGWKLITGIKRACKCSD